MKYAITSLLIATVTMSYLQFGPSVFAERAIEQRITGNVVFVLDGDTIKVLSKEREYKIDLIGIDAPELGQKFGKHAHDYLSDLVYGRQVTIAVRKPDRHGIVRGEIFLDGVSINKLMLEDGFAWALRGTHEARVWIGMERFARDRGFGLWRYSNVIAPWEYRDQMLAGMGEET